MGNEWKQFMEIDESLSFHSIASITHHPKGGALEEQLSFQI
jgi:hypothetical protein